MEATTVICPECGVKQTGFIREYKLKTGELTSKPNISPNIIRGIKCVKCGVLLYGSAISEAERDAENNS